MISPSAQLSRGSLAARTGVNSETIRYYEKIGLMPQPLRSAGGHRVYGQSDLKRLSFIRRSRELGFTLREIRDLRKIQKTLKTMASKCEGGLVPDCPIVDELYAE